MPRSRNQYVSEMRERFLDPSRPPAAAATNNSTSYSVSRTKGSYNLGGEKTAGEDKVERNTSPTERFSILLYNSCLGHENN